MAEEEKKEEEEEVPDWLAGAISEGEKRQAENPALTPPPVNTIENTYSLISEEDREKKFRRVNYIIIFIIILQIIALLFVILW